MPQQTSHTIYERLGTNKAGIRPLRRQSGDMFTAAKADFQKHIRTGRGKLLSHRLGQIKPHRRQFVGQQPLHYLPQRPSFAPSVKAWAIKARARKIAAFCIRFLSVRLFSAGSFAV